MDVPAFIYRRSQRRAAKSPPRSTRQLAASPIVPATLEEVLITHKLKSRRRRKPSSHHENVALRELARVMAIAPDDLLETLLRMALELCSAGTAGLSLIEDSGASDQPPNHQTESQLFRWVNVAGTLRDLRGRTTPKTFSPCGVTLDRNTPQLFANPARHFPYLAEVPTPLVEVLIIPMHLGDETPGTLWITTHDEEVKFDSEDVRIMSALAEFTASALRLTRAYDNERQARRDGAKELAQRQRVEETLRQTQSRLERVVDARTAQLQQLSAKLIVMQDEERRRIARDLHDSVGQYLAGIQMNLGSLLRDTSMTPALHRIRLTDTMDLAEHCTSEIRTISYLLHPPLLDEVGLGSAMAWYVEGFSARSGIRVDLDVPGNIGRLATEVETALFRVVQQSLANIHRHSASEVANIRMQLNQDKITLEIRDKGQGIEPHTLEGFNSGTKLVGVGMAGMRERIRDLGGEFYVRSSEKGTTITVTLPHLRVASLDEEDAAQLVN
ncbi:MAG: hypothetical protein NVS9B4_07260 [Candidatus Acidiferrum sp.]